MKKALRALLTVVVTVACVLSVAACDDEAVSDVVDAVEAADSDETWAVWWYLCGSDLESEDGAASADIYELLDADFSPNVQVVIETGGAAAWEDSDVGADSIQRWVVTEDGMELVDEQAQANMGDESTLAGFLSFCAENYSADHVAVILWNHGGGTAGGVAYDENYDYDSLSLTEIHDAFGQVFELSETEPPIELVGFDACLMASVDTAAAMDDVASYLVASEEMEPGCGWQYAAIVNGLSKNTGMDGAALGRLICDGFYAGCEEEWEDDEATLSVTDLSKLPALVAAYDAAGVEALSYVREDSSYYAEFARVAEASENYGGNTPSAGYGNMVDLGDLLRTGGEDLLPQTYQAVLDALDEVVVYKVAGSYREESTGLSVYHPYDGGSDSYAAYAAEAASDAFEEFYDSGLEEALPAAPAELEDHALTLDDSSYVWIDLSGGLADDLSTILVHLAYVSEEDDLIIDLGTDTDLGGDWETAQFYTTYSGVWGAVDGALAYREVVYEGDDYTIYAVPVLLNGEDRYLAVVYDYGEGAYSILGAGTSIDENFMAGRGLEKLEEGDELTMLHWAASYSGDDDFELYEGDTITVTSSTSYEDVDLGDGDFVLYFEMRDGQGTTYTSDFAYITVADGEAETYV